MATDKNTQAAANPDARQSAAQLARKLVREAWKATLSTLARDGGHPYGSLVAMATEPDGAPLMLLSGLAEHTKNILADQRASILVDGTSPGRAALTGPRISLVGRIAEADPAVARRRYLARHPDAEMFIDFADFRLYALRLEWAHLVAGFGRIVSLTAAEMLIPTAGAEALIAAEPSVLQHMNEDHSDAIARIANSTLAAASRPSADNSWTMIGCDREGIDLASGDAAVRVLFAQPISTLDDARRALTELARNAQSSPPD